MRRLSAGGTAVLLLLVACTPARPLSAPSDGTPVSTSNAAATPGFGPPPPTILATEPAKPIFHGTSKVIGTKTRARMDSSWRPGCPVPIEHLRLLSLDHWGFDGNVHRGELVVHRDHATGLLNVFEKLFDRKFPIKQMKLVDEFGGDDDRSMAANNTSAFNCRSITGGSRWSEHAYGRAIDINPVQNPYVTSGGTVLPPAGAKYRDRSLDSKGMIHANDLVVKAFAGLGWGWGGYWSSTKDYQHFSSTGR